MLAYRACEVPVTPELSSPSLLFTLGQRRSISHAVRLFIILTNIVTLQAVLIELENEYDICPQLSLKTTPHIASLSPDIFPSAQSLNPNRILLASTLLEKPGGIEEPQHGDSGEYIHSPIHDA